MVLTGLTSPLSGGQSIQLTFIFAVAGAIKVGVPVEPYAYDYATYSPPAIPSPTATVRPKARASGQASASAPGSASASASASPSATP